MAENTDLYLDGTASVTGNPPTLAMVKAWFGREILPLEASLMRYLEHNWRNASDIADLRQEVYVRIYEAALQGIPEKPRQYLFTTARNLLIRNVQHERIVPIEAVADLESLGAESEAPGTERVVASREEFRNLQHALERLPARLREAVTLGKIEGLSRKEISARMGVSEGAVAQYLVRGIRSLVDSIYGDLPSQRRQP